MPVECIRMVNTGGGNEYDLADTERNRSLENLEGASHIQVKEVVGIFLSTTFVDAVPSSYMDDAIAADEEFLQLQPIKNRPLEKDRVLRQIPWGTNIQNHRCMPFLPQHGDERLAEIARPACQKYPHSVRSLLRDSR